MDLQTPGRTESHRRYQYVLDFQEEIVDYIYTMIAKILSGAKISYIKWDMNRSITECYSIAYPAERQGEIFHRYILGVYDLYERLTSEFPKFYLSPVRVAVDALILNALLCTARIPVMILMRLKG